MLLDGNSLTVGNVAHLARNPSLHVGVDKAREDAIVASRALLDRFVEQGRVIYGVNTACGGFVHYLIPIDRAEEAQANLIRAVATNTGPPLADDFVRAAMLARLNSLCRGHSAISLENFKVYLAMYNAGIVPIVPEKGSLGASGDLGPLAFIAMVATGHWRASYDGQVIPGGEALKRAGIAPARLSYKEGLAMINGTSVMAGMGACLVADTKKLIKSYTLASCLSLEALRGKINPFNPVVHQKKQHQGQRKVAGAIHSILEGSNMAVHDEEVEGYLRKLAGDEPEAMDQQIEDAYSIRCTPQILGPLVDTTSFVQRTVENELNSTNDNPLILVDEGEAFHNGNFHGQYMSMAMDQLSICLTTLSNLSDRRTDRFLDVHHSNGLPAFLCKENPGLRYGLMGGQYVATSLTAENRSLCTPVSIQTLTSTADFQDHVSMGLVAARRTRDILHNTYVILGYELVCACQAADLRGGPAKLSPETRQVYEWVRERVPYLDHDEELTDHIEATATLIQSGRLLDALPEGAHHFDW